MKLSKQIMAILFAIFTTPFFAQTNNVLLDREFWKSNPNVETLTQKISEGNNPSESNANAFDAVTLALLAKADNETVKFLLSQPGNEVNKLTHDGRTYIFWSAYKGNLKMMEFLLENGAKTDVIDSHGNTVMTFAASAGVTDEAIYELLIEHGANISDEKNKSGANAMLLLAPSMQDSKMVDYFLSKGADLNTMDEYGNGLFNYAAKGGNIKFLKLLIDKGLSYKALNQEGGNAMLMASQGTRSHENSLEFYNFLKDLGIDVNVTGENGKNPLHNISYKSTKLPIYEFFINHGVDVNQADNNGNSPFMNAASRNDLTVVEYLLPHVKNINLQNGDGRSALMMAVNRNSPDVVEVLLKNKADINVKDNDGNTLAYYLLPNFNSKENVKFESKLKILNANGFDITQTQGNGNTILHLASQENNLAMLKRFENFNIEVNAKNNDGMTALQLAAMKAENTELLKYLISKGADKTVKTDFDETVYDLAIENELLQSQNSDINFLK